MKRIGVGKIATVAGRYYAMDRDKRCCVCSEPYTAKLSRMHNDSNVLAFGARVIGVEMAKMITEEWLNAKYEGGRHQRRVDQVMDIERRNQNAR